MLNNKFYKQQKMKQISLIPKEILYKLSLGKIKKKAEFFIEEEDLNKVVMLGNTLFLVFGGLFLVFYFLLNVSISLSISISLIASLSCFFVFSDYIRSKILERQSNFDELAFLIINSLSINMMSTESLPKSVELLNYPSIKNNHYREYFQKMIFELNLGKSEEEIINEDSQVFKNKRYRNVFQNLIKNEKFIETDPDFLISVKREIKLVEDNIVIFIAVSCLLPLVLSLILSFMLPSNSPSLLILPLLYAIFGTLILRLIQNKNRGDINE